MTFIIILAASVLLLVLFFIYRYILDIQITQRTEEFEHSKDQIEAIINSSNDALIATDINDKIILANLRLEKLFQIDAKKVVGQTLNQFFEDIKGKVKNPEKFTDLLKKRLKDGRTKYQEEIRLINPAQMFLKIYDAPILSKKNEPIGRLITFYDFTKEKEIDKVKTEFVSLASHQLRTPLSSMRWFLEMLLIGDAGELSKQQKDFVEQVYRSTLRMSELVNALLNISRLETGRLNIRPKLFQPEELIRKIIEENKQIARSRNCELVFEKPKNLVEKINFDPSLIRQVLDNFLSNAIKYSKWGEKIKVIIRLVQNNQETVFSVTDFGIGIPERDQPRVFQKFFRSDNAAIRDAEGAGLGLYICKMIIETSGGRIWFESKENEGTTFFFTLPRIGSPKVHTEGVDLNEIRANL